jgi:hypothetical protein
MRPEDILPTEGWFAREVLEFEWLRGEIGERWAFGRDPAIFSHVVLQISTGPGWPPSKARPPDCRPKELSLTLSAFPLSQISHQPGRIRLHPERLGGSISFFPGLWV